MSDVIYESKNSFKTQGENLTNVFRPGERVKLWARASVVTKSDDQLNPHLDVLGDVLGETYGGLNSITSYVDAQSNSLAYEIENDTIQFFREFRVITSTYDGTYTTVTVAGEVDRGFFDWTVDEQRVAVGNTIVARDIDESDVYGGVAIDVASMSPLTIEAMYLDTEDPHKKLIKIYDKDGNLLTSGYPNVFGYFNPHFDNAYWEYSLFNDNSLCPCVEQDREEFYSYYYDVSTPSYTSWIQAQNNAVFIDTLLGSRILVEGLDLNRFIIFGPFSLENNQYVSIDIVDYLGFGNDTSTARAKLGYSGLSEPLIDEQAVQADSQYHWMLCVGNESGFAQNNLFVGITIEDAYFPGGEAGAAITINLTSSPTCS